ncbi:MAG: hypothetical protein JO356_17175, partial [Acidobacteria bacterium]|nr:hypothetical protein [Acidobacteriota bacterium]
MTRREILVAGLSGLYGQLLRGQGVNSVLFGQVFGAVWSAVRDQFYDPNTWGVDWLKIKKEFAQRVSLCNSREELLALLQDMLRRLHNSHVFLYSREEWDLRQNVLPFSFDRLGHRIFIREPLQPKVADRPQQCRLGDEILSINQAPVENLQPYSLATIQNVQGNPNFGPAGSVAELTLRLAGRTFIV